MEIRQWYHSQVLAYINSEESAKGAALGPVEFHGRTKHLWALFICDQGFCDVHFSDIDNKFLFRGLIAIKQISPDCESDVCVDGLRMFD